MLDSGKVYKKYIDSIKKDRDDAMNEYKSIKDDKSSNDNIRLRKQQLKQFIKDSSDFCRSLCEIKFSITNNKQ